MPPMIRTPSPFASALLLSLAAGCRNDTGVQVQEGVLEFSPALLDLGVTAAGLPLDGTFAVDHLGGIDGRVLSVDFLSDEGDRFEVAGALPIPVARGTRAEIPIRFLATAVGYFSAKVQITHSGDGSPITLDVRAAALPPTVEISPRSLDFGPVGVGQDRTLLVTVSNRGSADLLVSERFFSDGAFSTDVAFPLVVEAGSDARVPVVFTPRGRDPVDATLEMFAEDTALPLVRLFGNDCENGLPSSYDRDGDGVTSCAGDCNDDRDDIRPGLPEVADQADQDCDGEVDEGTEFADDDRDGYPEVRGDCDDGDPAVGPGRPEVIGNGVDDDCDGVVDVGGPDADGDGYSTGGGDCDDGDPAVRPGAVESPDGVDEDCDGTEDEGTVARDDDGDGYCERGVNCTDGSLGGDCDDVSGAGPEIFPGAPEQLDGRDNDCDGAIDEGTAAADDDGDGYSENGGDCDDADPAISPGNGTC